MRSIRVTSTEKGYKGNRVVVEVHTTVSNNNLNQSCRLVFLPRKIIGNKYRKDNNEMTITNVVGIFSHIHHETIEPHKPTRL